MRTVEGDINKNDIILPKWLDDWVFVGKSGRYCPKNKDLVVLEWGGEMNF